MLPPLAIGTPDTLRIEVADPRDDRPPQPCTTTAALGLAAESGRGPLLAEALTARWGTAPYPPSDKTVWACLPLP
ncbi:MULTISPECIES: ATP-binding protein [Streptomyces]|uniref:ATP-binding protein n=1 Tax=Streptomyces TaxID=1883 RepID=UPI0033B533F4